MYIFIFHFLYIHIVTFTIPSIQKNKSGFATYYHMKLLLIFRKYRERYFLHNKKPIQHDLLNGLLIWFFEFHRSNLRFIVSGFVPVTLTYYFFGLYLLFWNIVSYYRRLHVISLVCTSLFLFCSETADQVFQ